MTPEQWQQVNDVFHGVMELDAGDRAAFLDEACAGNEELREQVESLIAAHEKSGSFIDSPAYDITADLFPENQTELVGKYIRSYRILAFLGSGGMGEVYLGEDTRLRRKVAIKILRPTLLADEVARKRLIKEAQVLATLDHPNVCPIYEVGDENDHSFIVMQYVDGETLADRLEKKSIDLKQALEILMEILQALAEAHSRGIIHRDVKPHNIMITSRGQSKLMDFGLAKAGPYSQLAAPESETLSLLTQPGTIIGTVPYMSPEQATGRPCDHRSDLFSLGAVAYECFSGRRPFSGASPIEICAQVIQSNPTVPSTFNPSVTPELDRITLKALNKNPADRYQSAKEMLADLRSVYSGFAEDLHPTKSPSSKSDRSLGSMWSRLRETPLLTRGVPAVLILIIALVVLRLVVTRERSETHQPSRDALRWYEEGTNALRDGSYYKAKSTLQRSVELDDRFAIAHARLAEAWLELDYNDRAFREMLRARGLVSDLSTLNQVDAQYIRAITHVVSREYSDAIRIYQEIVRLGPESGRAQGYLDLGRVYEKNDEMDKAMESYKEALKLDPEYAPASLRLGVLYSRRLQRVEALDAFEKAEQHYQTSNNLEGVTEVLSSRSSYFSGIGEILEARRQLQRALDIIRATNNKYQEVRLLLELSRIALFEGDTRHAMAYANQAKDLAAQEGIESLNAQALTDIGNVFYVQREYGTAEDYFNQTIQLAGRYGGRRDTAVAHLSIGRLYIQLEKDPDKALATLDKALAFFQGGGYGKETAEALLLRARSTLQKGDYKVALEDFEEQMEYARKVNALSQLASSHILIANLLASRESYSEALNHFERSCEIHISQGKQLNVGYSLLGRADMLWRLGRYDDAGAALAQIPGISTSLDDNYKRILSARALLIGSQMAMSQLRFVESRVKSSQAAKMAGTQIKRTAVEATYTLGLAEVLSGAKQKGKATCEEAVRMASNEADPSLLSNALLALAEVLLENSDPNGALTTALRARERFASAGQLESEWRSLVVAARAASPTGLIGDVRRYMSDADRLLSLIEQQWGQAAFAGFNQRRDVQSRRSETRKLAASAN